MGNRADGSSSTKAPLVREVLPPGREQTGVAVLLVAASALTFALAGSAFALWARSARQCPHQHQSTTATIDADSSETAPVVLMGECGPRYEQRGDAVDIVFRTCPLADVSVQAASEVVIEEQEGVMVLRIVK